jgi:hypothetical protein
VPKETPKPEIALETRKPDLAGETRKPDLTAETRKVDLPLNVRKAASEQGGQTVPLPIEMRKPAPASSAEANKGGAVDERKRPVVVTAAPPVSPSTPPWELDSATEAPLDQEDSIPGVHAPMGRARMFLIGGGVALAVLVGIMTGLHRPSSAARATVDSAHHAETVAAAAPPRVDLVPPVQDTPAAANAAPSASAGADESPAVAAPVEQPSVGTVAAAAPVGESPLPLPPETHPGERSALVNAAEQALVRGATDRALVLAGQAVTATPTDADAWLALGAAHKAAGDENAARADYRNCIAKAHTVGLNHCRVLAAH